MSTIDYNKLWKFISTHNASFEVPSHLICTLCQKLISNCRKTPCSCKYCAACIANYVKFGGETCYGKTIYCKTIRLNLAVNIKEDNNTNIEICNLKIECPNSGCAFFSDIWNACNHYDVCSRKPKINNANVGMANSINWGCELSQGFESYYDKLTNDNSREISLLKKAIDGMKNDKKKEFESLISTNKSQAEELKRLATVTEKLSDEINELKASKRQQNVSMDRLNKSNADLRKTLSQTMTEFKDFQTKCNGHMDNEKKSVNDQFQEKISAINKEINHLNKSYASVLCDIAKLNRSTSDRSLTMSAIMSDIAQLEQQSEGICFNMTVLMHKVDRLETVFPDQLEVADEQPITFDHSTCMYTWTVNNFSSYKAETSKLKNRKLTSKDFHASDNSYKIHFDLYPAGYGSGEERFMSIFALIKKSDQLKWNGALSYDITVSVIANGQKQNTMKLGRIPKRESASNVDHCVGIEKFIEIDRIFEETSLLDNNVLTLEFLVKKKRPKDTAY